MRKKKQKPRPNRSLNDDNMDEIPSRYSHKEVEDKWYKFWQENNLFSAEPDPAKKPFCIVIPPPNVTGILHMGHALNNTIQDILIRYHRMLGEESLWMPGTDHAGIATQNVVEKSIAKEGLRRNDLGRDEFVKRVRQWKEQYGSTIIEQLKKLGASCDWSRTRFTMDDEYSRTVKEVFIRLYEKKLIKRDNYIINWCPRCQTALSDEEAPHHEIQGYLYYIKYPFKDNPNEFMIVATTRPETMLGDTAVAVNPKDTRYKKYVGKALILPLINREMKIIADTMVDMKFGTGAVKVTPAHDPNDYEIGKRHNLKFINIMYYDGTLSYEAGDYANKDRFKARAEIVKVLKEKGLLARDPEPHKHAVSHCYRCNTIIEPLLSWQWFVRMKSLAKPAIDAVKEGKIKFYPKRWTKVYLNWMESIKDWCISRQIWWGHSIPAWYCLPCNPGKIIMTKYGGGAIAPTEELHKPVFSSPPVILDAKPIVQRQHPSKCPVCQSNEIIPDPDVLDTWFSSWLWPFATFGWPFRSEPVSELTGEPVNPQTRLPADLEYFYPTSVLVTAPEIIFFWVARMIMAGMEFMKDIPFRDVYIHGTVRDITGKKMSKSLGNIIDPIDIIDEYGADALRFSIISITAVGQDVFLSQDKFELGRNFANKIWNASRFILTNLKKDIEDVDLCEFFKNERLSISQRWILSRMYSTLDSLNKSLDKYNFNEAAGIIYQFFWHEFCDWYIELAKPALVTSHQSPVTSKNTQIVLYKVLEKSLRMLHPFMPFITEEIWQRLNQRTSAPVHQRTSIMVQPWPHLQKQMIDKKAENQMQLVIDIISAIRNIRSEFDIPQDKVLDVSISVQNQKIQTLLTENAGYIERLAKTSLPAIAKDIKPPKNAASSFLKEAQVFVPLKGAIDMEREIQRLSAKIQETQGQLKAVSARLKNKGFIVNAPPDVVDKEKEKKKLLSEKMAVLERNLSILK